jgi:putative hydrolase of the HAD superfamily
VRYQNVDPIPHEAMRGSSDWDDEDLLTVDEAADRLGAEIVAARDRIREVEATLTQGDEQMIGGARGALAAHRSRLAELIAAARRIKDAQARAPLAHSAVAAAPQIVGVVFDMGGVLTVDPYRETIAYAVELGIPERTFVEQLSSPDFHAVETGLMSMREFLKLACTEVTSRFGVDVDIRRLASALAAGQQIRPEMISLLKELASRSVRLALLTNNAKEARAWWRSGVLPLNLFGVIVDSSEIGVRKPDPAIFVEVLKRLDCSPAETLFFDDTEINVRAAASVGMQSVLFENPQQCRDRLRDADLLPAL